MPLPQDLTSGDFDALHDEPAAWAREIALLARQLGSATLEPVAEGTALVSRLSGGRILKVYPPFLRDHFEFERAMLDHVQGRLSLPTPRRLVDGLHQGWPYIVMSELPGPTLTRVWPELDHSRRCAVLRQLGALAAEVHALPVGHMAGLAPAWHDFINRQRAGCLERQRRMQLPTHLLAQVPDFVAGALPQGPPVVLTGEYTPFNLMASPTGALSAMFDFGDGLVGPREYDWLGPLCFLAAGNAARCAAFFDGYRATMDAPMRLKLLRLLLLHRYSAPRAQICCEGWQTLPDLESVAAHIWPLD